MLEQALEHNVEVKQGNNSKLMHPLRKGVFPVTYGGNQDLRIYLLLLDCEHQ